MNRRDAKRKESAAGKSPHAESARLKPRAQKERARRERPARERDARMTPPPETSASETPDDLIGGRNAVFEALTAEKNRVNRVLLSDQAQGVDDIKAAAAERHIPVLFRPKEKLDELGGALHHQGVLAYVSPVAYTSLDDMLETAARKGESPLLILLDGIEDPHNVGAVLRTADAAGVHGVLLPARRSASLTATVAKTSAGAVEHVPVAKIGNSVRTIRELKEKGFWIVGTDMAGESLYYEADLTGALLIVIGSEGKGIGRLVKENCDFLVRIPMRGSITSLNASVAGALLMYESLRQRTSRKIVEGGAK
ncbi:23S rRNA (guanosine(2251)-2'-O)-methyltransferase RlmB [Selenomonas sp. TAMA-11512]|uniref:23S rRNA (guanosine(2251)-2'-O)-methyltransferase RlmB n=1 Tax=Selenomonas sp. TAMA-11512 TaxID=3095337 RepID=UPI0030866B6E|nr:23S rRNA (guanosine(2251)-2'-O)-methyltransferase RlmB [Selenomonas sp. TAMA-11512]